MSDRFFARTIQRIADDTGATPEQRLMQIRAMCIDELYKVEHPTWPPYDN